MAKLELMTLMYSLDALLEKEDLEAAHNVVKRIIAQGETHPQANNNQ